jgi:hypothetical protein
MVPGTRATVLVTFATTGEIPTASKTGKLTRVPPPAIALIKPATIAAKKTTISLKTDIVKISNGKDGESPPIRQKTVNFLKKTVIMEFSFIKLLQDQYQFTLFPNFDILKKPDR